jgi:hypothetical protein
MNSHIGGDASRQEALNVSCRGRTPKLIESMLESRSLAIRSIGIACVVGYAHAVGLQEKAQNTLFKKVKI